MRQLLLSIFIVLLNAMDTTGRFAARTAADKEVRRKEVLLSVAACVSFCVGYYSGRCTVFMVDIRCNSNIINSMDYVERKRFRKTKIDGKVDCYGKYLRKGPREST